MQTQSRDLSGPLTAIHSTSFELLADQFSHCQPPYSEADARAFTGIYRRVYRQLTRAERQAAEVMVDQLIAGLEKREHAPLIFGVV